DETGRQPKSFLPYVTNTNIGKFKTDAPTGQVQYINSIFGESPSYALNEFDNSPLNRVIKSMLPGNNWAGNDLGVSADIDINTENEKVRVWRINYNTGAIPSSPEYYSSNQLLKNITTDEK